MANKICLQIQLGILTSILELSAIHLHRLQSFFYDLSMEAEMLFEMREGNKVVGVGVVTKVLN